MLHNSYPFMPVLFVSGTKDESITHKQAKTNKNINLDGKTICEFYKEIINTPPSREALIQKEQTKKIIRKRTNWSLTKEKINVNEMFRYAENNDLKGIEKCLKLGLDVNCRDSYGWTPLMSASCSGSIDVVNILLKNCADKNLTNFSGKKAIDLAMQFNYDKIVKLLLKTEFTEMKNAQNNSEQSTTYFCELCQVEIPERKQQHECSIVHQLNMKRSQKSSCYYLQENNKGFQIMLKKGWNQDTGLGPNGVGNKYPIKTILKRDRLCLGNKLKNVPRVTHFKPFDISSIERTTKSPVKIRQNTLNRKEYLKKEKRRREKEINFRREFY